MTRGWILVAIAAIMLTLRAHSGAALSNTSDPCAPLSGSCFNCTSMFDTQDCGYCAYEGALQGTGSCVHTLSAAGLACVSPVGQLLLWPDESCTTIPGDQCRYYQQSCWECATAPMQLNCGWCAATKTCEPGSMSGPNSDSYCGNNGTGWGFAANACSPQAMCNSVGGQCAACTGALFEQCGWCSSTSRCEYGNSTAPANLDCNDGGVWSYGANSCPVPDPCLTYDACTACLDTPGCGWCGSTSRCASGNSVAPSPSSAQCASGWSTQTCSGCGLYGNCTLCHQDSNCLWCLDSNVCESAAVVANVSVCSNAVEWSGGNGLVCPSGASGGDTPALPAAATIAIVALVAIPILALIAAILLVKIAASAIRANRNNSMPLDALLNTNGDVTTAVAPLDYSRGHLAIRPIFLVLMSLGLKIASLALNQWDQSREVVAFNDSASFHSYYGLLSVHTSESDNGASSTTSYNDQCAAFSAASDAAGADPSLGNSYHLCEAQRAAGLFVAVLALLSALLSAASGFLALRVIASPARLSSSAMLRCCLVGFSAVTSLGALLAWSVAAHVVIHHNDSEAMLGVSWWLMIGAFAADSLLQLFLLKMARAAPRPMSTLDGDALSYTVLAPTAAAAAASRTPHERSMQQAIL